MSADLSACGCCAGLDTETPVEVYNRPGLSAIAYRVATHWQLKESMLASLTQWTPLEIVLDQTPDPLQGNSILIQPPQRAIQPGQHLLLTGERADQVGVAGRETPIVAAVVSEPAGTRLVFTQSLRRAYALSTVALSLPHPADLTTRDDDDFSIALLDAWATVGDVLTFYSERIANENYLRTATERVSILNLARLIGYELRPGVAAGAWLAFKLEETPATTPPAIPGLPLPPVSVPPIQERPGVPGTTTIGVGTKVQSTPGPGERPQIFETVEQIEARVEWNEISPRLRLPHPAATNTNVLFLNGVDTGLKPGDSLLLTPAGSPAASTLLRVLAATADSATRTTRVDLEGGVAPSLTLPVPPLATPPSGTLPLSDSTVKTVILGQTWKQNDLLALAVSQGWDEAALADSVNRLSGSRSAPTPLAVRVMGTRAALFGHNAPLYASLPAVQRLGQWVAAKDDKGNYASVFDNPIYPSSASWDAAGYSLASDVGSSDTIYLDNVYPGVTPGQYVMLASASGNRRVYAVKATAEVSRTKFALTGKVTCLTLTPVSSTTLDFGLFGLRDTTVLLETAQLALADVPLTGTLSGNSLLLDGAYLGLAGGRTVVVSGERLDLSGQIASEAALISEVTIEAGFTRLKLAQALAGSYRLETVRVFANVARATHGESVQEVLGSGDAGKTFQRFTLRQPPLTYVSAPTPSGSASTLEIRVNDLLWHEVPSFIGRGPDERVYVTHPTDDGGRVVEFGDGITGARLPTGHENVHAGYRRGIGTGGMVKARALELLLTRPPGISAVDNPLPATGADDPEALDMARENAPLTVRTLDRIVSLSDYEDFARAYSGIAKAHVTWAAPGRARGVLLTVAGPGGAAVEAGTPTHENLLKAIDAAGDTLIPVRLETYRPALFGLEARVVRDPDYLRDKVETAVREMLGARFSFDARSLNQPVTLSEVNAAIQGVPGVVAVTVTLFALRTPGATPTGPVPEVLTAGQPGSTTHEAQPAWLLTIDPTTLEGVRVVE